VNLKLSKYDGKPIIQVQQAFGRHPHPAQGGRLVPFKGVFEVLLDDGSSTGETIYVDDYPDCTRTFTGTQSTASHMQQHTRDYKPLYTPETIKQILRLVKSNANVRNRNQVVANELNRLGVDTARGRQWTAGAVSSVYRNYKSIYNVRVSRRRDVSGANTPVVAHAATELVSSGSSSPNGTKAITKHEDILVVMSQLGMGITHMSNAVRDQQSALSRMDESWKLLMDIIERVQTTTSVDPEIVEKARRFDALMATWNAPTA
jgi:hypothetical protein